MSTEYYTEPDIPFERLLESKSVAVMQSKVEKYVTEHRLLHRDGTYVYAFRWEGRTRFEAFGANAIEMIARPLSAEFGVKFFDEYGVPVNAD